MCMNLLNKAARLDFEVHTAFVHSKSLIRVKYATYDKELWCILLEVVGKLCYVVTDVIYTLQS